MIERPTTKKNRGGSNGLAAFYDYIYYRMCRHQLKITGRDPDAGKPGPILDNQLALLQALNLSGLCLAAYYYSGGKHVKIDPVRTVKTDPSKTDEIDPFATDEIDPLWGSDQKSCS